MTMKITIKNTATGWVAKFQVGGVPQNVWLPLPFTRTAEPIMVARDLCKRFKGAELYYVTNNCTFAYPEPLTKKEAAALGDDCVRAIERALGLVRT